MRVGIEASRTSVSHGSNSCTVTFKIYTQNQYSYNDDQSLGIDGEVNWANVSYHNGQGGGAVLRATKTYKYNFDSNDYGSGNARIVNCNVSLSGAYNGVTPSKSVSIGVPKRPIAKPLEPTNVNATRDSDSQASVTWNNRSSNDRPWDSVDSQRWDNVSNSWVNLSNQGGGATGMTRSISGNRRWRFRVRAGNDAGWSGWGYSDYIQTTPASPSDCSATKSSVSSVLVRWTNGASGSNYDYDTLLEEQVDGGVWTHIATLGEGTASFNRTGRAPGSVYAYRVRHRSTLGGTTYSGYSTSGTIQLQSPPAAPTVVSTVRDNDNSFVLNWTNNPNGDIAPYDSLTVQRWDNLSGQWDTIGVLAASAVSLTDQGTVVNRRYQWRIAANNAAGASEWAYFDTYQTRPSDPAEVTAKAAPGGAVRASWINTVSYTDYTTALRYYKNGVLVDDTIVLAPGETTYLLEGVDLTATYMFSVKTVSAVGYASESMWIDSPERAAATIPNAPASLSPNGQVRDLTTDETFTWVHTPSLDESDQTAFEVEYSIDGGTTWVTTGQIVSTESSWTMPAGTLANGADVTWHVRTWGVHATAGPYSPTAIFPTSTTPTVTLNEPASGTLTTSQLDVVWSYDDTEATPQAKWEVELYNIEGALLEAKTGDGEVNSLTMSTVIIDGSSYVLRVRVQDGDGLVSDWAERTLFAAFTPPAEPILSADYSQDSGSTVLTLTPTPDDGGVTTLPPIGVDIQRRLMDAGTGLYEDWVTMAEGVAPDATLIDTTGPIADDGEYRIITYSDAPSAMTSEPQPPAGFDDRWVYLSGGSNFTQICRLMGNVALRTTTTRDRSLYQFAGRKQPVMFVGEARTRVIDVAGLLDGESSTPAQWEHLIATCDVMLLRDPLGHRVFGSVPQVSIDYLGNEMYAIAFTVTEVSYP
jgi:hypothetical protein